ncbi:MAG: hypothetical protein K6A44_01390 [bacterium]|nr:hypothetical protein [bacterium]
MKKIVLTIMAAFVLLVPVSAKTLKATVSLSWDNLTQTEITQDIDAVRAKIFDGKDIQDKDKKEFKNEVKPYKKDRAYKENYLFAESGGGEVSDKIVVPFFYKKYIYAYGIIYKNDLKTCYYYTALGRLFTVEKFEKNYGEFPVTSYQYKTNGVLLAVVYNISDVDQYMYSKDSSFVGRWYKENYYNGNGKVVMTRTLPEK